MKRVLSLFIFCAMCTACTVMVVPHSSSGKGQSVVYMSVTQGGSQVNDQIPPKPGQADGSYIGLSTGQQIESAACENLQEPIYSSVPALTPLSAIQRENKTLVENTLVDYILNLRAYIAEVIHTSNKFYTLYAVSCKNVAPPPIK